MVGALALPANASAEFIVALSSPGEVRSYPTITDLAHDTHSTRLSDHNPGPVGLELYGATWYATIPLETTDGWAEVRAYPTLADFANDTNGSLVGDRPPSTHGLGFDGTGWYTISSPDPDAEDPWASSVWRYATLVDFANDRNATLVGSDALEFGTLTYDGSTWYAACLGESTEVWSYPTIADLANDLNGTRIGTDAPDSIRGLAFVPEPSTGLLLGFGIAGLAALRRRAAD